MIKRMCVYCASSAQVHQKYFSATRAIADILAENKIEVVFGGGAQGLMGCLADRMVERGGRIIGIMPHFMREVEWDHKRLNEVHFVADMHSRKKKFLEGVDALLALPGGCGTLEELLEAITLKRLGQFTKPIIILNLEGYYDPLLAMLDRCIAEKFMSEKHRAIWSAIKEPAQLIDAIENAPAWDTTAIHTAVLKKIT